jgi:DNA-binding NtrC family response regulator
LYVCNKSLQNSVTNNYKLCMENMRILIADDDQQMLDTLRLLLKYEFSHIECLRNPNLIPDLLKKEKFDLILLDMNFSTGRTSGNEGLFWLREIKKINPFATVLMISAYATISLAIEAIKEGAVDFVLKPWDNQKLLATLKSACNFNKLKEELEKSKAHHQLLADNPGRNSPFIPGKSAKMQRIVETIDIVAQTDANILILGENGTGKEVIAREIFRKSKRSQEAFMHVDSGAIVESLFESEMFGHVKGAFTGAISDRKGRFELADKGTLFLDEIGNIPVSLQAKLLSAIQSKEFFPVGSQQKVRVDIRLICATNRDPADMVSKGLFREDLFYRINTIQIDLPPLRERREDISMLAEFFVTNFNRKYGRQCTIDEKTIKLLEQYSWPGNIRELQNTLEKAVIMAKTDKLDPAIFNQAGLASQPTLDKLRSWEEIERYYLEQTISRHRGNLTEVSRELKLSRPAIYRKMKKYGL